MQTGGMKVAGISNRTPGKGSKFQGPAGPCKTLQHVPPWQLKDSNSNSGLTTSPKQNRTKQRKESRHRQGSLTGTEGYLGSERKLVQIGQLPTCAVHRVASSPMWLLTFKLLKIQQKLKNSGPHTRGAHFKHSTASRSWQLPCWRARECLPHRKKLSWTALP